MVKGKDQMGITLLACHNSIYTPKTFPKLIISFSHFLMFSNSAKKYPPTGSLLLHRNIIIKLHHNPQASISYESFIIKPLEKVSLDSNPPSSFIFELSLYLCPTNTRKLEELLMCSPLQPHKNKVWL
jgi:hypothetical protein